MPPLHQQSHHDRASSVYSQPSPGKSKDKENDATGEQDGLHRSNTIRSEVSSLTMHSSVDNDSRSSPLVSPLSTHFPEHDVNPRQDHPFRSQLPRPVPSEPRDTEAGRTAFSYHKPSPVANAENKQETKWDDFSGEPTDSEAGKPASARPGVAPVEVQYPQLKERTKQILAGLRERGPPKKQVWGKAPPAVDTLDHPEYREPWKGASGRVALVEPVKNTPAARLEPLQIPQRNISRTDAISNDAVRAQSPQPKPIRTLSPERKEPTIRAVASQDSIKPVVPLKLGSSNSSRVVSPVTPMPVVSEQANGLQSPFKSPQHTFLHGVHESVTKPVEELVESPTDNEPLTPTTPTQANVSPHRPRMDTLLPPEPEGADISRFSWTTYNTTEHGSPTQPSFDISEIPPIPSVHSHILLRKQPVPSHTHPMPYMNSNAAFSSGSVVLRKPVPAADRNRSPSMISNPTLGKSLPQCPPELEASDKISTLEARLDDLARRKRNINKIKAALADALRRNAVAYDVKKRKEVETKLKNLDDEMSEVTQEEHEVGLRLHRAQKKRDREENNLEPTSLWIKRVTS